MMDGMSKFTVLSHQFNRRRLVWDPYLAEMMMPIDFGFASFLRQSPVVNHLSFTCGATC